MDSRRWTVANQDSRCYYAAQSRASTAPQNSGLNVAHHNYYHHDEYDNSLDGIDSSPSPPERQGMSRARVIYPQSLPRPFMGQYEAGRREVQDHGWNDSPSQPFSYVPEEEYYKHATRPAELTYEQSNHNTRASQPWMREPCHRTGSGRDNSPASSPDNRDRQAFGCDNPRNSLGLQLRPVSDLPDRFRGVFKFGVFNAMQSECFDQVTFSSLQIRRTTYLDQVLHSQENLVISAPTGSGKTVLFELGIIHMLMEAANGNQLAKCVYVAPTKALCCELTGDTLVLGKGIWGDAKNAQIIVTTAEKWDSLTRNWADHSRILSQIRLFLVDEVHILNESRGSTLEVVISRMKARGSAIRFVLVSATVPNIEDVASWIGSNDEEDPATDHTQFGEEFRPCKLKKFVHGVAKSKGQNDFAYAHTLDSRLFPVLQQHSADKPILIFCPTRKGTVATAKQLAKDYERASMAKQSLPWSPPMRINSSFHDKELTALATMGIAVHHAGLSMDDRKAVEELYLQKTLRVLVATSTLAVGVNLPAHMVVIKGVKLYQNGEMREYSDLDIMQMMGRAGRPQFDDEGIAIILCETELEHKYRALVQGTTTLESSLHQNLAEHLNSEIGLGTISNVETAKDWLHRSFLFRRIQKNPQHYDIGKDENQTWKEKIDEIVMQSILNLRETQLITYTGGDGKLSSTEYGDVMSKFYIRQSTMRAIMDLPTSMNIRDLLEMASSSEELGDLKLRSGEKQMYEKIRRHNDIRFPPKKVFSTSDKILLLIQAILAGLPLNSPEFKSSEGQPYLEAISTFRHVTRIVTAVAEVAIIRRSGAQLKHALELVRCLNAKAWEDRPLVLRQIEHIGEKSVKALAENGIKTIQKLLQTSPLRIEELLNRRSPFGFEVLAAANEFPKYFLNLKEVGSTPSNGNAPVEVELSIECGMILDNSAPQRVKKPKQGGTEMTTLLVVTSDLAFVDFRRTATKALQDKKEFTVTAQLTKPSQAINVYIASEKFAGITVSATIKPHIASDKYPTVDTRPLTSVVAKEKDLEGLEDVPDFWDMDVDDDDTQGLSVMDLTIPRSADASARKSTIKTQSKLQSSPPVTQPKEGREPKKRPDGKYDCHEGLLEPPRAPKKKGSSNAEDSEAKAVATQEIAGKRRLPGDDDPKRLTQAIQVVAVDRPKPPKRDPILQQLDSLHMNADIARNLRLTDGPKTAKRSKTAPNFDLQLTTLRCSQSPLSKTRTDDDDDDELPLISELLDQEKLPSETNYSNSEVDALIRDMPLDDSRLIRKGEPITSNRKKRTRSQRDERPSTTDSPPSQRIQGSNLSYRPYAPIRAPSKVISDTPPPKRLKTNNANRLFGCPSHLLKEKTLTSQPAQPLFLQGSDDVGDLEFNPGMQERSHRSPKPEKTPVYEGDFYLDETHFDIVPDPASEATINQSSTNVWNPTQLSSSEWSRDDASTHQRLCDWSRESAVETALLPRGVSPPAMKRKDSYALSPTRISGFMKRSQPDRSQERSKLASRILHQDCTTFNTITRKSPVPAMQAITRAHTPTISISQVPTSDVQGDSDDPLAEFERWLTSGAVDIIPD
ncbi:hypothetical protein HYDPIDRAFT_24034 [Hydnomerulius pinastri MD-312]|nr:hypothetical protein HYDPIDRAFT_24034 [Hydnomerulius pinastri MD-312]